MPSLGGIAEIIGIRAEIIGVRQYLADGREIERINQRIADSTKRIDAASVASVSASRATAFAMAQEVKAKEAATVASRNLALAEEAEARASANAVLAARAAATRPTGANGQFISQAAAAQVTAQQAQLEAEAATARERANVSLREANALQATAAAAATVREAAEKRAGVTAITSEEASTRAIAASIRARELELAAIAAVTRAEELKKIAQESAARVAPTVSPIAGPNGQAIVNTADTAALAENARIQKEASQAQKEATVATKEAADASKFAAAAIAVEDAAIERDLVTKEHELRIEKQLSEARRSRLNAATTTGALAVTAVIGVTAGAAITSAAKYQQELSKINVLTNATDAETQQLGQSFLKLSTEIPVSASDLAAASYKLLSSGIRDTGQALEITTGAAKAAVAGQADIKDIITATIAVLNGYPKGAITASQVNDILFAGVKEGAAEFNDFAGSIGKLIPIAAALGVPFDQLTASLAVLTNGGLNAEEAATGLRAILNDLAKDENSKQAQEALAQFGLTVSDLRKKIRDEGLPQTMGELITLFKGNLAAIEPIIPNIRGMVAAFSAFNDGGKTTTGVLSAIDRAGGIVDQSFAKTKDNVANLAKTVSNQLNVALIEIGTAVLPEISKQLQGLIGWISANKEAIASFVSEGLQTLAKIISDIATGFETLRQALSDIVGPADSAKVAIAAIGIALAWALPGGPYLKGLALILALIGQIQNTKIDLPLGLGSVGGRGSELQILKENQKELEQELKNLNSGGPGGLKGKILDIVTSLPGPLHNQPSQNIQENPELAAARANIQKKIDENSAAITAAEQKEADAKKKLDDATKPLTDITLPKLNVNIDAVDQSAKKAAADLQKLAQEFQKSSDAAGQVESLTTKLKLFGEITPEIAKGFGLDAVQAGNVQGVDAVARATERATNRAFEFTKALATVAEALQQGGAAAVQAVSEIIHGIASAALEASQSALSALLSQPTREVADLGVNLAFQQQRTTNLEFRNQPAINSLNQQLKNIDKQIAAQNRANTLANRAAERQQRAQQAAQKAANDAAQQAADDAATAFKNAQLQAQINAERQLAALQKLIDANNKAAADLQEAFLKNNEALQVQINTAIGKGDSTTALALVDQQRAATKQYRDQSKALQKNTQDLTSQQKAAQEAEAERQRQAQLDAAAFEATQKQIKATTDNTSAQTDNTAALDAAKQAQDDQTQALEDSKQKIQDQIDALQAPIDASKEQADSIQRAIDLYESQGKVLKAQGIAADHTLKTQDQQWQSAKKLIAQIDTESATVKKFSDKLGIDTIKAINDANEQFDTLTGLLKVLNDPSGFIAKGFDPVAKLAEILKTAIDGPAVKLSEAGDKLKEAATAQQAKADFMTGQEQVMVGMLPPVSPDTLRSITDYVEGVRKARDIVNSIKPPNVGDAGLAVIQTSTTAAQTLGTTLALQVNPPDIGDAGRQTIDNATSSTYTYDNALRSIQEPDVGDAGRGEILGALDAARQLSAALRNIGSQVAGLGRNLVGAINNLIPRHAQGGVFTKATLGIIGEAGPEVVLPLNDVKRISQILAQASVSKPGLVATTGSNDTSNVFDQINSAGGGGLPGYSAEIAGKPSESQKMQDLLNHYIGAITKGTAQGLLNHLVGNRNKGFFQATGPGPSSVTGSSSPVASQQIVAQLSPQLTAAIAARPAASAVFAPNITVTGETLDTMEATALAAVRAAFRDARLVSGRTGGLITTGLGPSH